MPIIWKTYIWKHLHNVMKKFSIDELETQVMPFFPELSWDNIKDKLVQEHLKLTSNNAIDIIESDFQEFNIALKILNDRLSTLELIDISRHSSRKNWYSYKLKGLRSSKNVFIPNEMIRDRIIAALDHHKLKMLVKQLTYNDMIFLSLKDKPKDNAKIQLTPTFFALVIGQDYFFCSKKQVTKFLLEIITEALGYTKYKKNVLVGKDLKSLSSIMNAKKQGMVPGYESPPKFEETEPVYMEYGFDFTQHKQRKEFTEKCFGSEPMKLETLKTSTHHYNWKNTDPKLKLSEYTVKAEWEICSHNIFTMLPKLAERDVLVQPLPNYISDLILNGKNEIVIK